MDAAIYGERRAYGKEAQDPILDRVNRDLAVVNAAIILFEQDVWFGGFQAKVHAARHRGFRADFAMPDGAPALAMAWSCAGRVMITIEFADDSAQVSVVTADDSEHPAMGLQGISATRDQAVGLLRAATTALARGAGFKRDDKVGMA